MFHISFKSNLVVFQAKEKIVQLKEERSSLAGQELGHLLQILEKIEQRHARKNAPPSTTCSSSFGSKNSCKLLKIQKFTHFLNENC